MAYDLIVVGAGSAGSPLARRLADEAGFRVLLLEGGGSDRHPFVAIPAGSIFALSSTKLNWNFPVEPDPSRNGRADAWPAGKCLGGGSAINGMMFIRGHPKDYDRWAAAGCAGWSYEETLPYFTKLEDNEQGSSAYRGVGGPQRVSGTRAPSPLTDIWMDSLVNLGFPRSDDLNGSTPDGVGIVQATQKRGWRHTAGSAFVRPVLGRSSLDLQLHATVDRIVFEDKRAVGVQYRHKGRFVEASAKLGVIVSAGAMASPALLQRSGVGPPDVLRRAGVDPIVESYGVGANLQDHPGVSVCFNVDHPTFGSDLNLITAPLQGLNFLLRGRGPLTTSIGHAQAFVRSRPDLELPDLQLITSPFAHEFTDSGVELVRDKAFGMAIGVMRPGARGTVHIRSSDPDERPMIAHELLGDDGDVKRLIEGVRIARRMTQTEPLKSIFQSERLPGESVDSDDDIETFIRETAYSMYHQVGTCRMGVDDNAVVDSKLRVRGAEALWVADASIMPDLPSGNTNATCIMIGERAADLIGQSLKP